jgi:Leucine-rich repeat (LRR) protein
MNRSIYAISLPLILSLFSNKVGSSSKTLAEYEKSYESFLKTYRGRKGYAPRFREIDLSGQNLDRIPDFVFKCTNLKVLILNDNQISAIPDDILKLTKLEKLHIDNNNISQMPKSFEKMKGLKWLSLKNNNLKTIPINYAIPRSIGIIVTGNPNLIIPKELADLKKYATYGDHRKYRFIKADWEDVTFDIDNPYLRLFAKRNAIYSDINWVVDYGKREQHYRKMADSLLKPFSQLRRF